MMELLDRLVDGDRRTTAYRERTLIAHLQVLIASHRHPQMYQVEAVISDAETAWREANERLLQEGL